MRASLSRLWSVAEVDPAERVLAGRVAAGLWMLGGFTVTAFIVLPGVSHRHPAWIAGIAAAAAAWGLVQGFAIQWDRAPRWVIHLSAVAAVGVVAGVVASSGGSGSPGWIYLFFVAIFVAYFFHPAMATVYILACVLTQALPTLYDPGWSRGGFPARLIIAPPTLIAFGVTIYSGKLLMRRLRARAELLAAEQSALRRIATAVIEGEEPESIYALVAREAAALLGAGAAGILRFDGDQHATVMGSWADHEGGRYVPGSVISVAPGSDVAQARDGHIPVRIEGHPPGSPVARLGYSASIVSPVIVAERSWGALAVAAGEPVRLTGRDEQQLMEFGELLASAIASIDERATLAAQASTDPLTGLANRRALQERLVAEVSRAQRHKRTLAVAVVDIDHFKEVNDFGGHDAGDAMLVEVAASLADQTRAEDTLGRIGGDEFAWIMPETTREQALVAVERARRVIGATVRMHRVTVSAGICDTDATSHPAELLSFADTALYWSKAHGRNRCWIYDSEVLGELAEPSRGDDLERFHAVLALRSLARAIDAKDPATREHSERVAELAVRLARNAGWNPERTMLLREAALMHDVGKVGVPEDLLTKKQPLTALEARRLREHAELTARIVEGVLAAEQVDWIRAHHERPDGTGYPRGLRDDEIPEGAALLSVADAWDIMTSGPYSAPKSIERALHECAELVGRQFTRAAVGALLKLHADGELDRVLLSQHIQEPLPGADFVS